MGYLEENLKVMELLRPGFYKLINDKIEKNEYDCSYIEEIDSRDGNKVLCIDDNGRKIRLNSLYRPVQEAEKWAEQFDFNNIGVSVVMFGMGNCIFVRELLKRVKDDCVFFLSEPDLNILMYNLMHQDMTDILSDNRVSLFVNEINEKDLFINMQGKVHWSMLPTQIVCNHPVYDRIYKEKYNDFVVAVNKLITLESANRNTDAYMGKKSVLNIMKNMHFIKESNYIKDYIGDIPEDVPAIIVSAGPSLDKNIDKLKMAEGKAFILATDTAVKYLLAHDIKFDAAITLDPKKNPKHMEDPRCADVPVFTILEGRNRILEFNKGRKIWLRGTLFMSTLYNKYKKEFPDYNIGGSVATAAFNVCLTLKFKRIVLIGQDLAYSGNSTHAGGVETNAPFEEKGTEWVEGIDGEKIRSRADWIIYRDWFEDTIRKLDDVDVIDATEGGALIHGTKIMTLADVIDKYCDKEFLFRKLVDEKPYTFSDEEYMEVRKDILHLEREFNNIKERAVEGKKAADSLCKIIISGNRSQKKEDKYIKIVRKTNNFIEKQPADELLDEYITSSVTDKIERINCLTDDEDQNMLYTMEVTNALYDALISAVDELHDELQTMLASV